MFHWWILEALENMAAFLFDAANKVAHHGHDAAYDDDFYDRLSRRYSVILLIIFTVLVSTKQYVGEPIACFCPAHFTGTHVEYTNNVCWISNTYFVSFDRLLPKHPDPKTEQFIYFYQYVPFILIVQAILFYIPSLIWSSLNSKSGYNLGMLVSHARIIDTYTSESRGASVRYLARFIDKALEYHKHKRLEYVDQLRSLKCSSLSSIYGFFLLNNHVSMRANHLMWSFLFSKFLYLLNAFGQLYLLNFFLGNDYHMYGFAVIRALFTGNDENWTITPRFPRVTWCNFAVRNLADNIHTYTVQCSLPINLFNEKIFLIIWFWLYFTTFCTLFGFLYWASSLLFPQFYKSHITRYLSSMKRINIHHFPQNPYQEQQQFRHHPYSFYHHHNNHHHSSYHRRHSFAHSHYGAGGSSHYGSIHGGHNHHGILSSFASRTLKPHLDLVRMSRLREQLTLPTDNNEHNTASSVDEQTPPSPSTPQTIPVPTSRAFSVSQDDDRLLMNFLTHYLGRDGILVIYILQMNTNEVITGEIVTALYELFKTNTRSSTTE
ncbi:unnamed protein product [Adineta steineri]|uniref:Innexin n=1 Tax=Adineta steineri TaxID=433720 RepID=A0A813NM54_9BILA|nr:unnamed protein product [Adineta steineri]CAF0753546.1 unnamed protein product [Adineta steineri]